MAMSQIARGPEAFEHLLELAGLSEREADAARTVVLGMTAAEAAPKLGVSASTVGSYRQRAFAKLGVSGRAEFLALPAAAAWQETLEEAHAEKERTDSEPELELELKSSKGLDPLKEPERANESKTPASKTRLGIRFLACLCCGVLAVALLVTWVALFSPRNSYASSPHGVIETDVGEVPDVTGMCVDSAASELANCGYLPLFVSRADDATPGTVLEVGRVGDVSDVGLDVSSFSWGQGCTASYEVRAGNWGAYVELVVAV